MEILTDFYELLSLILWDDVDFELVADIGVDEGDGLIDDDVILVDFVYDPVHEGPQHYVLQEDVERHGGFGDEHSEELLEVLQDHIPIYHSVYQGLVVLQKFINLGRFFG